MKLTLVSFQLFLKEAVFLISRLTHAACLYLQFQLFSGLQFTGTSRHAITTLKNRGLIFIAWKLMWKIIDSEHFEKFCNFLDLFTSAGVQNNEDAIKSDNDI